MDIKEVLSSECEYDWYWNLLACSTEYKTCDSFASLTRQQISYYGSDSRLIFSVSINWHPDNIMYVKDDKIHVLGSRNKINCERWI
jgi:hypothetical protein